MSMLSARNQSEEEEEQNVKRRKERTNEKHEIKLK